MRSWIFLPKAIITRILVLFLYRRISSIRGAVNAIYRLMRITLSFSKIYVIAQIHLARQVYPDPKFLEEAYYNVTSRPYGYLLLDLKTINLGRFRTCIFPEDTYYVYVSRKSFSSGFI